MYSMGWKANGAKLETVQRSAKMAACASGFVGPVKVTSPGGRITHWVVEVIDCGTFKTTDAVAAEGKTE